MKIIRFLILKVLIFLSFTSSLTAGEDFKVFGELTYASNYVSRGISQSGDLPALQGKIGLAQDYGWHSSVLASEIDYKSSPAAQETIELTFDLGYKKKLVDFDIDFGVNHYHFPDVLSNVDFDFQEVYFDLSKQNKGYKIGNNIFISDNNFNQSGKSAYYNLYLNCYLSKKWVFNLSYGYQEIEKDLPYGSSDYSDWLIGFDYKAHKNILFKLFYTGNDIEDDFCNETCGEAVTASTSYVF